MLYSFSSVLFSNEYFLSALEVIYFLNLVIFPFILYFCIISLAVE